MAVFVRIAKKCLTFGKIRSKSSCHIPFTHALNTLDSIEAYLGYLTDQGRLLKTAPQFGNHILKECECATTQVKYLHWLEHSNILLQICALDTYRKTKNVIYQLHMDY